MADQDGAHHPANVAAVAAAVELANANGDHQRANVLLAPPNPAALRPKKKGGRQKDPIWQETTICEDKTVLCNRCHTVIHRYGCTKVERIRLHFEKKCLMTKRQKTHHEVGGELDPVAAGAMVGVNGIRVRAFGGTARADYSTKMGLFRRRMARWLYASGQDFHEMENKLLLAALKMLRAEVALPTRAELENDLLDLESNSSVSRVNRELSSKTCCLMVEKWKDSHGQIVTNYGAITDEGKSYFLECTTTAMPSFSSSLMAGTGLTTEQAPPDLGEDIERIMMKHKRALFVGVIAPAATDLTKAVRERVQRKSPPTMFYHGCVCHALRLLIKDVCTIVPWLATVQDSVLEMMKLFDETNRLPQLRERVPGLLLSDAASNHSTFMFDTLEVIAKSERDLLAIVSKRDFVETGSTNDEQEKLKRIQDFVLGESFLQDIGNALTLLKPLQSRLLHFEADTRATISQVYHCFMELLDLYANMECISKKEKALIASCVNERFELIYGDAHGISYMLDPVYLGESLTPTKEAAVNAFIVNYCSNGSLQKQDRDILNQLARYKEMVRQLKDCNQAYWELLVSRNVRPLEFWTERRQFPELQKLAWLVFSLTPASTSPAMTFCAQTQMIHTKFVSQLPLEKVHKLTHIYCNEQNAQVAEEKEPDLATAMLKDVQSLRYSVPLKRDAHPAAAAAANMTAAAAAAAAAGMDLDITIDDEQTEDETVV